MKLRSSAVLVAACAVAGLMPAAAQATFPGRNGAIVVTLNDFQGKHHGSSNTVIRALSPTQGKPHTLLNCVQYAGSCPGQVQRPNISSDGRRIAFSGVYVTDVETFQAKLTLLKIGSPKLSTVPFTTHDSTESDFDPAWLPGSAALVFGVKNAAGPAGLFTETSHGGALHKISGCGCSAPAVSPLGGTVLVDRGQNVWSMGTDGSHPHVFAMHAMAASWSPDAKHVAFASRDKNHDIVIVTANGGSRRTVVKDGGDPVYSPNGKLLAFERSSGGKHHAVTEILTVPVKGGHTHLVLRVGAKIGVGGFDWRALPH